MAVGLPSTLERSRRVAGLEELPAPKTGCGSTASANPKIDVEVPVRIVFGLPTACGPSRIRRRRSPCCFALLDRPAFILVNMAALLCHPALTLFNEGRKSDGPIIRDFDVWRGASDAHGGDRGINLHVAGLRHLAGNESECSLGQTKQGRIRRPVRVINELV